MRLQGGADESSEERLAEPIGNFGNGFRLILLYSLHSLEI
jgi:hypothetical protein